jgi:hypothetical protein
MSKVVTGTCRASYARLMSAEVNKLNGKSEYSVVLLIPKSDKQTIDKIKAAAKEVITAKWGAQPPKGIKNPLKDGDTATKSDGSSMGDEFKGHFYLSTKCDATKHKPTVIDSNGNELFDPDAVISGDYIRASMNAFAYDATANRGVSFGLNNVQLVKKGEPLGSSRQSAHDEFGIAKSSAPAKEMATADDDDWA